MRDVKVERGDNRQFNLLAVNLLDGSQYHVEISVTRGEGWSQTPETLLETFERKFFGKPAAGGNGHGADSTPGRNYPQQIFDTYRAVGLVPEQIQRVYCCWILPEEPILLAALRHYSEAKGVRPIQVLSFRDEILPRVEEMGVNPNSEEETFRMLSLSRKRDAQKSVSHRRMEPAERLNPASLVETPLFSVASGLVVSHQAHLAAIPLT